MAINIFELTPHQVSRDLRGVTVFFYGDPKTGKTTTAARFPKSLLLAFEKGYMAIPGIMAQPINNWGEFKKVLRQLKEDQAAAMADEAGKVKEARKIKEQLEAKDTVVVVKAKTGEGGRLFGTISSTQIAKALKDQFSLKVDRRRIDLPHNLASLGQHNVPVRIYKNIESVIKVNVQEE